MVKSRRHGWAVFAAMTALAAAGFAVIARFESGTPAVRARAPGRGLTAAATWRARSCASASPTPPSSPRSPPTPSCGAVNGMHDSFTPSGASCPAQHPARRGGLRRRRRGDVRRPDLRPHRGLSRGADGGPHARSTSARRSTAATCGSRRSTCCSRRSAILGFTALALSHDAGRAGILNTAAAECRAAHPTRTGSPRCSTRTARPRATTAAPSPGSRRTRRSTRCSTRSPSGSRCSSGASRSSSRPSPRGNMAKKQSPPGPGFPVEGALFVGLLASVILVVGALTFFPALSPRPGRTLHGAPPGPLKGTPPCRSIPQDVSLPLGARDPAPRRGGRAAQARPPHDGEATR
jgi:K+-transporting ATPase ATPase A chain